MLRLARSSAADCASKSIKEQLIARWIVLTSGGSSRQSPTVDDLSRAWAILNLPPGSSEEAVRAAYRELVKSWHPDRFQGNADKLDEAHEMLKEVNWAYDYLSTKVFANQPASETALTTETSPAPPPPQETVEETVEEQTERSGSTILWIVILVILVGGGFFYYESKTRPTPVKRAESTPPSSSPNASPLPEPIQQPPVSPPDRSVLKAMIPVNKLNVVNTADGLVLSGSEGREFLQAPRSIRPPFVFRAIVKTSEADVRFYYGLGLVILNWYDNPSELRFHDFATSAISGALRKGRLEPNVFHELVFDVQTNSLTVSVDGEVRFEGQGFYRNLNTAPGIGPAFGEITVKSVIIDEAPGADIADGSVRPRVIVAGDLLATMIPMNGVQTNADLEGLILSDTERKGGAIMTQQKFHPPLVIRTRAKTDSLNLRLFYGSGVVIFNWEANPAEMRVHDPATGRATGIANKGRILPNEWQNIVWEIARTGMRITVNGQLRFQCGGDYSKVDATAGIGEYLSKVTVASFVVEQK
jgi:hypothetical protein